MASNRTTRPTSLALQSLPDPSRAGAGGGAVCPRHEYKGAGTRERGTSLHCTPLPHSPQPKADRSLQSTGRALLDGHGQAPVSDRRDPPPAARRGRVVAPDRRRRFRVLLGQVQRPVRAGSRAGAGRVHEVLRPVLRGVQLRAHGAGGARRQRVPLLPRHAHRRPQEEAQVPLRVSD